MRSLWLLSLSVLLSCGPALAQDGRELHWKGGLLLSDDWFRANNWEPSFIPGAEDRVVIGQGPFTVFLHGQPGVRETTVDGLLIGGATLPSLEVAGITLHIGSQAIIGHTGTASHLGSLLVNAGGVVQGAAGVELIIGQGSMAQLWVEDGGRVSFSGGISLGNAAPPAYILVSGSAIAPSVLETSFIAKGESTHRETEIIVDGGILRAMRDEARFLRDFSQGFFNMGGDGVTFDTNGYEIGIDQTNELTGTGQLAKVGSGTLSVSANGAVGRLVVNEGEFRLTQTSRFNTGGSVQIAPNPGEEATLTLEGGATLNVLNKEGWGKVEIGPENGSRGVLNIGSGDLGHPTPGGTLNASLIEFGYDSQGLSQGRRMIRFNQSDQFTLLANIQGVGELIQRGTGVTTLSGNLTNTVAIFVEQGTLNINGVAADLATVTGGTLGGTGRIGAVTLTGGLLSPGNSPGTLEIGAFTWEAGNVFFELGGDLLNITTFSTQADTLVWTFADGGWEAGETYTLLTLASGTLDPALFGYSNGGGFHGSFSFDNGALEFTLHSIPEPRAYLLLLAGAAIWVGAKRRRRARVMA